MTGSSVCGLERSMFTREETRVLTKVPRIKPVGVPNVSYVFVWLVSDWISYWNYDVIYHMLPERKQMFFDIC